MLDTDRATWTDPETGEEYDLSHFLTFETAYEIKFRDGTEDEIQTLVRFSNHCYTRSMKEGDDERHIVDRQPRRGGIEDIRVFCPYRWEFSLKLRAILETLLFKQCLTGSNQEILYRQEDASPPGDQAGWYICMRLDYKEDRDPSLEISVRSVHWRPNRPEDTRGGPKRFCILLRQYLERRMD